MLVIMQLLMRNVSFLGHLAGILVGYLYSWSFLSWIIPSLQSFVRFESRFCFLRQRLGYVLADGPIVQQFRPLAVFHPRWGREEEIETEPPSQNVTGAFQAQGRRIGESQPPPLLDIREPPTLPVKPEPWRPSV
jgi:hypothetical protein